MKDRVILFHPGQLSIAFDVFRKKGSKWRPRLSLYEYSECKYMDQFLNENPEFEYVGSGHIPYEEDDHVLFMRRVVRAIQKDDVEVILRDLPLAQGLEIQLWLLKGRREELC